MKQNEFLTEHAIKKRSINCRDKSMETMFMHTKTIKTNELHTFFINLLQKLDLKTSNKHVAPQNLSIYYAWKNIRQHLKKNKLKIITLKWNNDLE